MHSPDSDEVIVRLCLQQGEVEVYPISYRDCQDPGAILGVGVLVGEPRGVDGAILRGDVSSTGD